MLSGDDALTLPLMAVGGHGLISVAGNEVPGEMARMVEHAEQNDFAGARQIHDQLLPLMLVNFIESNPIPVKSAMAAMGLLEEVYRLPMVPPREASRARIRQVLGELKTDARARGRPFMTLAAEVESLSAAGAGNRSPGRARRVRPVARAVVRGRGAGRRTGSVDRRRGGGSIPGSSRASCSGSALAISPTCRPTTGAGRSSTRTRCR